MCQVKIREAIENKQDIQNVITALLFRQEKAYKKDKILALACYYCTDSQISISEKEMKELIDDSVDVFSRRGAIERKNGYCIPQFLSLSPYTSVNA